MSGVKFMNKLQGKRVLIFGGTSGMGYAVAEAAVEHGCVVFISGSSPERLQATVQKLKQSYSDIENTTVGTIQCDLSSADHLEERLHHTLHAASENGLHKIDHIVFTAGDELNTEGGLSGTTIPLINSLMGVRVYAPILIAKIIATNNYMHKSSASSLTLTSGVAHIKPRKTWSVVSMLSGALQALVVGLALDLAPIRVNVVNPGATKSPRFDKLSPEAAEQFRTQSLTGRVGEPEDVAEAYLYCMKSQTVDGTAVTTDSGRVLI